MFCPCCISSIHTISFLLEIWQEHNHSDCPKTCLHWDSFSTKRSSGASRACWPQREKTEKMFMLRPRKTNWDLGRLCIKGKEIVNGLWTAKCSFVSNNLWPILTPTSVTVWFTAMTELKYCTLNNLEKKNQFVSLWQERFFRSNPFVHQAWGERGGKSLGARFPEGPGYDKTNYTIQNKYIK